jgi:dCMP deaminase
MVKLRDGWLKEDVERAAQRVDYWQGKEKASVTSEMSNNERWDRRFLELAKHIATWSKDPSTQTGCVIVDDKRRVVSVGYNGFPRALVDYAPHYEDRETKYKLICHADRNALDNAPCQVEGMTMYITHPPCVECQKSILQKGIRRVVWYKPKDEFKDRWGTGTELLTKLSNPGSVQLKQYETT